jgi:hypothetical protein
VLLLLVRTEDRSHSIRNSILVVHDYLGTYMPTLLAWSPDWAYSVLRPDSTPHVLYSSIYSYYLHTYYVVENPRGLVVSRSMAWKRGGRDAGATGLYDTEYFAFVSPGNCARETKQSFPAVWSLGHAESPGPWGGQNGLSSIHHTPFYNSYLGTYLPTLPTYLPIYLVQVLTYLPKYVLTQRKCRHQYSPCCAPLQVHKRCVKQICFYIGSKPFCARPVY